MHTKFLQNLVKLASYSAKFIPLVISWLLHAYNGLGDPPLDPDLEFDVCWDSLCTVYENATAGITSFDVSIVILSHKSYAGSEPSEFNPGTAPQVSRFTRPPN
jgi:hypothetical protein